MKLTAMASPSPGTGPSAPKPSQILWLAVSLLSVGLVVVATRTLAPIGGVEAGSEVALGFGTLILACYLGGELAKLAGMPKVTGYLFTGFLIGPEMAHALGAHMPLVSHDAVHGLSVLDAVAIGIIAFKGGAELEWRQVRPQLRVLGLTLLGHGLGAFVAVTITAWFALPYIGFAEFGAGPRAAIALLLGTIAVAISPATTLAIRDECKARGPLSDTALGVTILADVTVAVLFAVVVGIVRPWAGATEGGGAGLWLVVWEIAGSIGLGVAVGAALGWLLNHVKGERPAFLLATAVATMVVSQRLHLSGLLVALVAGAVVQNWSRHGHALVDGLSKISAPFYVLFFGLAGTHIAPSGLAAAGWALVLLPAARAAGIRVGTSLANRRSALPAHARKTIWKGLIGQAGMTLALAQLVKDAFPSFGAKVQVVVLGMIAVHELFGPVLFRRAIIAAGEAGAADVPDDAAAGAGSAAAVVPAH
jgi:Kef-type K+ transport system membrane component KefB